jgi:hypothetical protein
MMTGSGWIGDQRPDRRRRRDADREAFTRQEIGAALSKMGASVRG